MITQLWLIRHGPTAEETHGRCYGSLDVPLAEDALPDLAISFQKLPHFDALYCSPRRRCMETAELIGPQPIPLSDLRELHFGDFEGKTYEDIARMHPDFYAAWMTNPTAVTFPNGESFEMMRDRVLPCVATLRQRHAGQTLCIVAHGGVNRIILADALGLPETNLFRVAQKYGAVNLIRYYDDYPLVELMNGF